jgi:hypothetical protein
MPDEHQILAELKRCMRDCHGNQDCMDACQAAFEQAGGTVTPDGGKVFLAPDGSEAFVTNGGKVFGGKVF